MISVEEALGYVVSQSLARAAQQVLEAEACGLVLAEDVTSDIDSPPFDKALMDGYAVIAADISAGVELRVLEEVVAGKVPTVPLESGAATRIMTGAPLPELCDAVVMFEQTEPLPPVDGPPRVRINQESSQPGDNLMRRGESMRQDQVVVPAGRELRPVEIGLLSEVGRVEVSVVPRPSVAVLPTGDEIVSPDRKPAAGQIRNSNGPMLLAAAERAGARAVSLGVGPDDRDRLRELITQGLESDVLVLSGGVSAGVLDLVPGVLKELGVEAIFHQVRLKPGRPLWFGTYPRDRGATLVFGLPGNPVSSLVGVEVCVRTAIDRLSGRDVSGPPVLAAQLACDFQHRGARPTYHPAVLEQQPGGYTVAPVVWRGSPDLYGVSQANALACFPAGDKQYQAGDPLPVLRL